MSGAGWKLMISFGAMCAVFQIQPSALLVFGVVLTAMFLNWPDTAKALTKPLTRLIPFLAAATDFLNSATALLREMRHLGNFFGTPRNDRGITAESDIVD